MKDVLGFSIHDLSIGAVALAMLLLLFLALLTGKIIIGKHHDEVVKDRDYYRAAEQKQRERSDRLESGMKSVLETCSLIVTMLQEIKQKADDRE